MNEGVAEALRIRRIDPSQVANFKMLSEDEIKSFSMEILAKAPQNYGPHFLSKYWHLIGATPDDPFHLGDHPVVLDNDAGSARAAGFVLANPALKKRGAFGLASPGVTIYLPLSATLCLAMTDPALMEELFAGARKVRDGYKKWQKKTKLKGVAPGWESFAEAMRANHERVNQQIRPLEEGTVSPHDPRIVMRVNSLQMLYAGRWIVSSNPDYSLPLKMIEDDPSLRERRKLQVD